VSAARQSILVGGGLTIIAMDTVDIDIYSGFTGVELTAGSRTGACLSYRQ